MGIIWTIVIGFIAGVIAKFLMPGKNEPAGFILTTILGIVGAIVATYLGQALGWYGPNEGAGFIGAIVGAVIVLAIWGFILTAALLPDRTRRLGDGPRIARSERLDRSVLRHAPELAREPQLGDLLLQRRGNVVPGLEVDQPHERPLELARVSAPVELGLRFDEDVHQICHCDLPIAPSGRQRAASVAVQSARGGAGDFNRTPAGSPSANSTPAASSTARISANCSGVGGFPG